jgi:hypothetical protein
VEATRGGMGSSDTGQVLIEVRRKPGWAGEGRRLLRWAEVEVLGGVVVGCSEGLG